MAKTYIKMLHVTVMTPRSGCLHPICFTEMYVAKWATRYMRNKLDPIVDAFLRKVCPSLDPRITHSYNTLAAPHADILAQLSVYTTRSFIPSYAALLSHFLRLQSALPYTAILIVPAGRSA